MEKMDFTESEITHIITHFVGNKAKGQTLKISSGLTHVPVDEYDMLQRYLFSTIKLEEYFMFHHNERVDLNPVYSIAQGLFADRATFVDDSANLAQLLYEASVHPKVIDGEFTLTYIKNIKIGEEYHDAIGMFKSETQSSFMKFNHVGSHYEIATDFGYDINKIDKACLIFNVNAEEGFDVIIADKKSNDEEARFWKNVFLGLKPVENDFYQTKVAMHMTKNFVESPMPEDSQISLAEQIELLNKSANYFKKNEQFDRGSFEEAVLSTDNLVKGFQAFEETVAETQNLEFPSNFDISKPAVKKNSKIFKSVLKLDKNFSIYIHGDRSRAERGEDEGGRYYKFYYDEERNVN